MEHAQSSGGFLDSIITGMVDFSKDVVAIARGTARGGAILAEQGIEAIKGTVELLDPIRIAEDISILTSRQVPETRINPNTGRAETVFRTQGILERTLSGVGNFISGAVKGVTGFVGGIIPSTPTIIIVLGLVAIITIAIAVPIVTATT